MTATRNNREDENRQALQRAEQNKSEANYPAIIEGFAARGVDRDDIHPRENVLTYDAWQAKGRQVIKGERGVQITTAIEVEKKNKKTGKVEKKLRRRSCRVFHYCQTKAIDAPDPPNHTPLPVVGGDPPAASRGPSSAPTQNTPAAPEGNPTYLRERADAMQAEIDKKRNPAILQQNPTRRRMNIGLGMVAEAGNLEGIQRALRGIADAIEARTLPACLWGVRYKSQVADMYYGREGSTDEQQAAVNNYANNQDPAQRAAQELQEKIQAAEADLVGQKIDGFFPTPKRLAERMAGLLNVQEGEEVLEPSAGKGDLAEAVREHSPPCKLFCIERFHPLADLLELKGFEVFRGDCLQASGWCDRIIMNPPYEKGQDADHVWHCWEMLNPGGRMVALVGRGLFFRGDQKSQDFREWLDSEPRVILREDLEDAFNQPGAFRRTGVACTLLVLDKV